MDRIPTNNKNFTFDSKLTQFHLQDDLMIVNNLYECKHNTK